MNIFKTEYKYIKNGKLFVSPLPLYYFEWTENGGNVRFGLHGSEDDFNARKKEIEKDGKYLVHLHKQEAIQENIY